MNLNNFTIKSQEAVQKALEFVQQNGNQQIETGHLLKAVMSVGEDVVGFLFSKIGVAINRINSDIETLLQSYSKVSGGEPYLSKDANAVLQKAQELSTKEGDQFVSLEFILLSLLLQQTPVSRILKDAG